MGNQKKSDTKVDFEKFYEKFKPGKKGKFPKQYLHFDHKIPLFGKRESEYKVYLENLFNKISNLQNAKKIEWRFIPLIKSKLPKYSIKEEVVGKLLKNSKTYKEKSDKNKVKYLHKDTRPIMYCGHKDRLLYTYYNLFLSQKYEEKLKQNNLENSIIAYREIKKQDGKGKGNLDFAKDVFEIIKNHNFDEPVVALAYDIKGFFDNLDHEKLKQSWLSILDLQDNKLPPDHFKIYESVTKYSFFNREELFRNVLKFSKLRWLNKKEKRYKIVTPAQTLKRHTINGKLNFCLERKKESINHLKKHGRYKYEITNLNTVEKFDEKLKKWKTLSTVGTDLRKIIEESKKYDLELKKWQEKGYCLNENFIFEVNKQNIGIPQGLPISGLLANIYLLEFDKIIQEFCKEKFGSYFRYSDDILIICPQSKAQEIQSKIFSEITKSRLTIKDQKTNRIIFLQDKNKLKSFSLNENFEIEKDKSKNQPQDKRKLLQYLGLEFDGQKITLRPSSLAKNLNKLTYKIKKYKQRFYKKGGKKVDFKDKTIFVKKLMEYTHLGKMNFYRYAVKLPKEDKIFDNKERLIFKKQLKKQSQKVQDMIKSVKT